MKVDVENLLTQETCVSFDQTGDGAMSLKDKVYTHAVS